MSSRRDPTPNWSSISPAGHGPRIGRLVPETSIRSTILIAAGRGDSLELRQPLAAALADRRHAVVMVEHRGQGASGRLGAHRDAVHIDSFDTHLDDLHAALDQITGPVHLLAHSMGGLLGAMLLARHPDRFSSALFTSPMWGWAGPVPNRVVATVAGLACSLGKAKNFAPGEKPFEVDRCVAMRTASTLDEAPAELAEFGRVHRDLVRGGSTWGWTRAAAAMMGRFRATDVSHVDCPITIVSCRRDTTVSRTAHRRALARFGTARLVELDAGHDPYFGSTASRTELWAEVDRLLGPSPGVRRR